MNKEQINDNMTPPKENKDSMFLNAPTGTHLGKKFENPYETNCPELTRKEKMIRDYCRISEICLEREII